MDSSETSKDNDQKPKKTSRERVCPLESRFISVTPKDVLILAQFINSDGTMRTQEQTGLCDKQYRIVSEAVFIAQDCFFQIIFMEMIFLDFWLSSTV